MLSFFSATAQASSQVTPVHEALTQEKVWLNTERPLIADDLKGRIILVDFWTYCCINCIHIMPDLAALEEQFGDKLTVIGVHSAKFNNEKDTENIRQAIIRYNLHHAVVNDANFRIWRSFGVRSWPTLVLINPNGEVERAYSGEGNKKAIERDVTALIEKYKDTIVTAPLPYAWEKNKQAPSIVSYPGKITPALDRNLFFISDSNNNRIVGFNSNGQINIEIGSSEAGNVDGSFTKARFNQPQGVVYRDGILYVADTKNHTIRKVDLDNQTVTTVAGTGTQGYNRRTFNEDALKTSLASPWDVAFYPDSNHLAIAMAGTHQLWTLNLKKGEVSVLAGNGQESIDDGPYPINSLSQPSGLAPYGNKLYFVDSETSSLRVLENGFVSTLIGEGLFEFGLKDGDKGKARMQHSIGVFADNSGVYVADTYNHAIRKYNPETGELTTLSGNGSRGFDNGSYKDAHFSEPNDILRLEDGSFLVVDTNNHAIRKLQNNIVTTLALMPKEITQDATFDDELPNLDKQAPITVSQNAHIDIQLEDGWKINADAPTYFAVFDESKKAVQQFEKDEIKAGDLNLNIPKEGNYTLQGIFYICEAKDESFCFIKSVEKGVTVSKKSSEAELPLNLHIPQMKDK